MKHVITIFFIFLYFTSTSQNCDAPGEALIDLNVNNIKAGLRNSGDFWWNGSEGRYITPSDGIDEVSAIFAGGLWIGGVDELNSLKLAAVTYRTGNNGDYYPGPLDDSNGQPFENGCTNWDRFWVVNGSEVEAHKADFNDGSIENLIDNIYSWPGRNNPHFESLTGFPIPMDHALAPFFDNDQDGNYDPDQGDYPLIKGDQSIWWVFNDFGPHRLSNASPIQIEVQAMAYAFASNTNEDLNNATFYDFKLINKAFESLKNGFIGLWVDFDLGCHEDDHMGYDDEDQMMYVYNEDALDGNPGISCSGGINTYGENIPMLGIKKLDGAINPVTSLVVMGNGTTGAPVATTDPSQDFEYYNYLKGGWRDGIPVTVGGDGFDPSSTNVTKFAFDGDPSDENGWSMCSAELPFGDRRAIMSSALPDLQAGQSISASYAVIYADNINYPCPSLDRLKDAADNACSELISSTSEITQKVEISISPNPGTGAIKISSTSITNTIKVYGLDGQLIKNITNINQNSTTGDMSSLTSNSYLLSIQDNEGNIVVEKFVKID